MNSAILIFGAGGHAKVVYDIIRQEKKYNAAGFVSLSKDITTFCGIPHFDQNSLKELPFMRGIVAIGDNFIREKVVEFILSAKPDFDFISVIHPTASIGTEVKIGKGTVVMPNVSINIGSVIGDHVIVNTNSSIDHDCRVGNFASIAPGAVLGGNVSVGNSSAISIGTTVIHGIDIGVDTVVGAHSLVLNSVESNCVAFGTPCRKIRGRTKGEKYL